MKNPKNLGRYALGRTPPDQAAGNRTAAASANRFTATETAPLCGRGQMICYPAAGWGNAQDSGYTPPLGYLLPQRFQPPVFVSRCSLAGMLSQRTCVFPAGHLDSTASSRLADGVRCPESPGQSPVAWRPGRPPGRPLGRWRRRAPCALGSRSRAVMTTAPPRWQCRLAYG